MAKKGYGNIYELLLPNGEYAYICWIADFSFGIFDYISKEPTEVEKLLSIGFKTYKSGKETAIKKKIWKLVGCVDLEDRNITYPDLVIFMPYDKEHFIECSRVMRSGNPVKVETEEYLSLLKNGYIYGFFDNYKNFERWIMNNIKTYPANEDIFPLPSQYT